MAGRCEGRFTRGESVEPMGGFEPPTSPLPRECSTPELHGRMGAHSSQARAGNPVKNERVRKNGQTPSGGAGLGHGVAPTPVGRDKPGPTQDGRDVAP